MKEADSKKRKSYTIVAIPYQLVLRRPMDSAALKREVVPSGEIPDFSSDGDDVKMTFQDLVKRFLTSLVKFVNIEDENAGLRLDGLTVDDKTENELRCVLKSGKYGYAAELYDIKKKGVSAQRKKTHCELLPFACRFAFSKTQPGGILVIEKFGPHSIVGILKRAFDDYLEANRYHDWIVDFRPVTSRQYVQKHLDYTANSFHLIGRQVPKDVFSLVGSEKIERDYDAIVDLKVTFKRKKYFSLKKLQERFQNNEGEGVTICDAKFDGVSAELPVAGKLRKVCLNDLDAFLLQLDVTDKVEYDDNGHPKAESFYKAAEEGLFIAKRELGGWLHD